MIKEELVKGKRMIPLDQPIKITLLFLHFIGFSVWYGGAVVGTEANAMFPAITAFSGLLLVARELYKDGFVWLIMTEGVLTLIKVVALAAISQLKGYEVV